MKLRILLLMNSIFFLNNFGFAQSNLGNHLDSLFTTYLDSSFSGSVLVAEKNKIILKKGYGYANNETKRLNTPKTLFNVAGLGKQFTVYSILLLEERGLLSTNDYLKKYVGEFNDIRDSVTVHQVLIHCSGLFKEGAKQGASAGLDYSSRAKFIQSVKDARFESKPNEKYRYVNDGYVLLAAVIEIVSGQTFETFLLKNIFEPFKLQHTGFPWEERMDKGLFATGYNSKHEPRPPRTETWRGKGENNFITNVEDLYNWMKAFQKEKFITTAIRNKMLYDYLPNRATYCWNKALTSHNTKFYHKRGENAEFESYIMWYPDDQVTIIFLLNNDYDFAIKLFNIIRVMLD